MTSRANPLKLENSASSSLNLFLHIPEKPNYSSSASDLSSQSEIINSNEKTNHSSRKRANTASSTKKKKSKRPNYSSKCGASSVELQMLESYDWTMRRPSLDLGMPGGELNFMKANATENGGTHSVREQESVKMRNQFYSNMKEKDMMRRESNLKGMLSGREAGGKKSRDKGRSTASGNVRPRSAVRRRGLKEKVHAPTNHDTHTLPTSSPHPTNGNPSRIPMQRPKSASATVRRSGHQPRSISRSAGLGAESPNVMRSANSAASGSYHFSKQSLDNGSFHGSLAYPQFGNASAMSVAVAAAQRHKIYVHHDSANPHFQQHVHEVLKQQRKKKLIQKPTLGAYKAEPFQLKDFPPVKVGSSSPPRSKRFRGNVVIVFDEEKNKHVLREVKGNDGSREMSSNHKRGHNAHPRRRSSASSLSHAAQALVRKQQYPQRKSTDITANHVAHSSSQVRDGLPHNRPKRRESAQGVNVSAEMPQFTMSNTSSAPNQKHRYSSHNEQLKEDTTMKSKSQGKPHLKRPKTAKKKLMTQKKIKQRVQSAPESNRFKGIQEEREKILRGGISIPTVKAENKGGKHKLLVKANTSIKTKGSNEKPSQKPSADGSTPERSLKQIQEQREKLLKGLLL